MSRLFLFSIISLIIGYILDLIFGDPRFLYHPVIFIGKVIKYTEIVLRKIFPKNKVGEFIAGIFLPIIVIGITCGLAFLILFGCYKLNFWVYFGVSTFMTYQILATKCLKDAAIDVYNSLEHKTIEEARYSVSMIVGRETKNLSQEGVIKACVESVAESTSDGVIAPMFYMFLGGPILGFFYKAINTMDSMVAYKNKKYFYFGKVAARLDDFFNLLPSRLTGIMIILSSGILRYDMKNAAHIFHRDRYKHESPNSAQCEAPMAGALDIMLGGDAVYEGHIEHKPTLGDDIKQPENKDIKRSINILYLVSLIWVILFCTVKLIVWRFIPW